MKVFDFSVESFQFFKLYEKEAKPDKRNFKRGLALAFNDKNSINYWKNRFPISQGYFFRGKWPS